MAINIKSPEQVLKSFYGRIKKTESCWIWTAGKSAQGYGSAYMFGKHIKAHRMSYLIHVGDIPAGKVVMHSCDNPSCVNPDHLSVGSYSDNIQDCVRKGRFRGGRLGGRLYGSLSSRSSSSKCKNGHDMTLSSNVYQSPNSGRMCKICKRAYDYAYRKEWIKRKRLEDPNGKSYKKSKIKS